MLLSACISVHKLARVKAVLDLFVVQMEELYRAEHCTFNIHQPSHLAKVHKCVSNICYYEVSPNISDKNAHENDAVTDLLQHLLHGKSATRKARKLSEELTALSKAKFETFRGCWWHCRLCDLREQQIRLCNDK